MFKQYVFNHNKLKSNSHNRKGLFGQNIEVSITVMLHKDIIFVPCVDSNCLYCSHPTYSFSDWVAKGCRHGKFNELKEWMYVKVHLPKNVYLNSNIIKCKFWRVWQWRHGYSYQPVVATIASWQLCICSNNIVGRARWHRDKWQSLQVNQRRHWSRLRLVTWRIGSEPGNQMAGIIFWLFKLQPKHRRCRYRVHVPYPTFKKKNQSHSDWSL